MNTANLQLEGLYVAIAALMAALREKDVLTEQEIDAALGAAEEGVACHSRATTLNPSHAEAVCFPLRYLRLANKAAAEGEDTSFQGIAAKVGRSK